MLRQLRLLAMTWSSSHGGESRNFSHPSKRRVIRTTNPHARCPPTATSRSPKIRLHLNTYAGTAGKAKGDDMEPRVMAHSQSHRLRERMVEASMRHGQE